MLSVPAILIKKVKQACGLCLSFPVKKEKETWGLLVTPDKGSKEGLGSVTIISSKKSKRSMGMPVSPCKGSKGGLGSVPVSPSI